MKRGTLYRKLFIYFQIVILLSLTSVGVFTYVTSSKELDIMVEDHMVQIVNNSLHQTELFLKAYERSTISLLTNKDIRRFVDLPHDRKEYDYYRLNVSIRDTSINPIFIQNPEIVAIYILSFSENALSYYKDSNISRFSPEEVSLQLSFLVDNTNPRGNLSILNHSTYQKVMEEMGIPIGNVLTIARQIRGVESASPKGILAIEFRSSDLSALWSGIDLGENGYFFIVDNKGEIIYHSIEEKVGQTVSDQFHTELLNAGNSMFELQEDGTNRVYISRYSDYSDWNLVVTIPSEELRKPISNIRFTSIAVGLFTLVIAMWLAFSFSKSITGPIKVLKQGMRQTEKGNWSTIPLPKSRDEITELMARYNLMVNRLSELVDEVYRAELKNQEIQLERKQAEYQALQLQINPHFLYNSFETIVCYAVIQDSDEISEIVKSLAYMLRYSSQTSLDEITVANELKHVMHYLVVLQHRIGREFEIIEAIDSKYLLHNMVRLTLQPIVENVFQHAFFDGIEDYHFIRIDAGEDDKIFWVSVEDNGCGMSEQKLADLREKLNENRLVNSDHKQSERGGIGLLNVHRRIQMVFGEEYGLQIESELGQGTKITMLMPSSIHRLDGQERMG